MAKSIVKNVRLRNVALQVAFLIVIASVAIGIIFTARSNIIAQGLTPGFGFLERSTGWDIGFSLVPYSPRDTYLRALYVGFLNTLFLAAITLPLGTLIGVVLAVMRTSNEPVLNKIATVYVEIFRNIPLLLQLIFWYSVLTSLPSPKAAIGLGGGVFLSSRGIALPWVSSSVGGVLIAFACLALAICLQVSLGLSPKFRAQTERNITLVKTAIWVVAAVGAIVALWLTRSPDGPFFSEPAVQGFRFRGGLVITPELAACVIAISIYGGAFFGEILRAGLEGVPSGQIEAASALGLRAVQSFKLVRFPLAVRSVLPTLANQYIWLSKATTFGIAVGFADFYKVVSTAINESGATLELIAILMLGFLSINYGLAFTFNRINEAIRLKGTQLRL